MRVFSIINIIVLFVIITISTAWYYSYKEERYWFQCEPIYLPKGEIRVNCNWTVHRSEKREVLGNPYKFSISFFDKDLFNQPNQDAGFQINLNYKLYQGSEVVLQEDIKLDRNAIFDNGFIAISNTEIELEYTDHLLDVSYDFEDSRGLYTARESKRILIKHTKDTFWGPKLPL